MSLARIRCAVLGAWCALSTECSVWSYGDPLIGGWTTTAFSDSAEFGPSAGVVSMRYTMNFHDDGALLACSPAGSACGTFTASLVVNYLSSAPSAAGCTYSYFFRGYTWQSSWRQDNAANSNGTPGTETFSTNDSGAGSTLTVSGCLDESLNHAAAPTNAYHGEIAGGTEEFAFNGSIAMATGNSATPANGSTATFSQVPIDESP